MFAIGGTGFKPVRRFLLPIVLAGLVLWSGVIWWKCAIMAAGLMIAFCLPYGERTPYWAKALVANADVLPTLILGFSWWQIITPNLFLLMFWLSNWKPTANIFSWKFVEFLTGSFIGITVASLLKISS